MRSANANALATISMMATTIGIEMTPALRKQLFERWKELGGELIEPQPFDYFTKHIENGLIHVQMDGVEAAFGYPTNKLPFVLDEIVWLSSVLIPPFE